MRAGPRTHSPQSPTGALSELLCGTGRSALFHAGWLVQAQLGMVLSWSWFGGLAGVGLWWLLLAFWSGRAAPARPAVWLTMACVAAGGLMLCMGAGSSAAGLLGWGANLVAWAWLCSHLPGPMPSRRAGPPKSRGLAWAGVVAGVLLAVYLAADAAHWAQRWPLLAGLLMLTPWLAHRTGQPACPSSHRLDAPMGLMMGSLLLMAQWCGSLGWSAPTAVTLHLLAMVAGALAASSLARADRRTTGWVWAAAAALCGLDAPWAMLCTAALVAAAASAGEPRALSSTTAGSSAGPLAGSWAWALAGSALLLLLGHLAGTWGPEALRLVLMPVLMASALACLVDRQRSAALA